MVSADELRVWIALGLEPPEPYFEVDDARDDEPIDLGSWPAVVAGPATWCDVDSDDDVEHNTRAHPIAAVSLAILLRQQGGLAEESAVYSLLQGGPEFATWRAGRVPRVRPEAAEPAVLTERRTERRGEHRLIITFNRPQVHNAFNTAMRDGLAGALAIATGDPTLEVELRGAGPTFCSGGDLDEFGNRPDPATAHITRLTRSPAKLLTSVASRTTVYLHGACRGGGVELAAFAAHVIADPAATFGLPEIELGLIPGAGGTVSLPRRIGRRRTALLGLSGRPIDASTALEWGLVDVVRPLL